MGALLTPMFFLQFFLINGMGSYMLTPGFAEGQVTQWSGTAAILGWDKLAFYNPSFLMLTLHRTAANFAYGGFFVAAVCGVWLYRAKSQKIKAWFEGGGRLVFSAAFASFLTLPLIGFFYAWVLKYHGKEAYDNLMIGRGDVVAGGIDWWWTKQLIVPAMIGMGLIFSRNASKKEEQFAIPKPSVYTTIAIVFLVFYLGMAIQMTWLFFWGSLGAAVVGGLLAKHLTNFHGGSGRGVFVLMGILSFLTVCLGGYVREASRPRFESPSGEQVAGSNRISPHDNVYHPQERATGLGIQMVRNKPAYVEEMAARPGRPEIEAETPADLVSYRCISCHTLERIHVYRHDDWDRVVGRMRAYGMRLTDEETRKIVDYLAATGGTPRRMIE